MEAGISHNISGADKFQLLIDRHILRNQSSGNVIQLNIEVSGKIELEELRRAVAENKILTQLNSLRLTDKILSVPQWKNGDKQNPVSVSDKHSEPSVNSGNLLHIALKQNTTNSIIIISAHHILADNMGIQQIAKLIDGSIRPTKLTFTEEQKDTTPLLQQLIHTLKATILVFKKTPKRMARLIAPKVESKTIIIDFDAVQTKQAEENAAKNGARLSRSAFYLAAVSVALKQTIFKNKDSSFFLPVPQNQRLRGNEHCTMGNQLSFLFYTIPFSKLNTLSEATAFITQQMLEQIKDQSPKSYSYLLKSFRFLPLWLYDIFFKMPTIGSVCSFLFSDVGETLPDMKTFMGRQIINVLNIAPNPAPPHLTFVMMKYAGSLKLIITYNSKAISKDEIGKFEVAFTDLLSE